MQTDYFVIRDDAGRWIFSDAEADTGLGGAYRSPREAIESLDFYLKPKGRIVTNFRPEAQGFRVETSSNRPMLYSSSALDAVKGIGEQVNHEIKRIALDRARSEGRTLVTDDDIWKAAETLDWSGLIAGIGDE